MIRNECIILVPYSMLVYIIVRNLAIPIHLECQTTQMGRFTESDTDQNICAITEPCTLLSDSQCRPILACTFCDSAVDKLWQYNTKRDRSSPYCFVHTSY